MKFQDAPVESMVKNKDLSMRRDTFDVHALNVAHLTQLHSSLVVVCVVVVVVVVVFNAMTILILRE